MARPPKGPKTREVKVNIPCPDGYDYVRYGIPCKNDYVWNTEEYEMELIEDEDDSLLADFIYSKQLTREEKAVTFMRAMIYLIEEQGREVIEFTEGGLTMSLKIKGPPRRRAK